ncbi:hypothetical protein J2S45_001873 [Trueperella abortisuis]|uniref:Uncharacterized protein n=1 Tax=Trueperella abortisuis TaxID=445930 RepID=A0ABT9PKE1_9ACTO|nr:hypothetical protein [Trueperella abortisuis]
MTYTSAPLTPAGRRRLAVLIVKNGWSLRRAPEHFHKVARLIQKSCV